MVFIKLGLKFKYQTDRLKVKQFQTQAPENVKTFPMNTNFLPGNAFKNDKLFGV